MAGDQRQSDERPGAQCGHTKFDGTTSSLEGLSEGNVRHRDRSQSVCNAESPKIVSSFGE